MKNEDYRRVSGAKKPFYGHQQQAERLNDSVPLATLYKTLVKHYAQQNRYIDKLEKENDGLKKEVIDKMWLIQSLKEKFEHTEIAELQKEVDELKQRCKNQAQMFENFIRKHKGKDISEGNISELIDEFKSLVIVE